MHTFENWQWQEPYLQNSLGHRARRDYPSRGEVREGGREGGRKGGGERRLRARSFILPLAWRIVSLTTRCSASFTSSAVLASSSALSLLLTHRVEGQREGGRGREEGGEGGEGGRERGRERGREEGGREFDCSYQANLYSSSFAFSELLPVLVAGRLFPLLDPCPETLKAGLLLAGAVRGAAVLLILIS